ncbi:glucagon-like peptide 2 receptor isoform X2 [Candoia aspera]|uniref:glucagon-like peptide 2 receptor isoform X2 n=1 Tax=Candoia aspera TaxID=51853 RepID=UPI002FD84C90
MIWCCGSRPGSFLAITVLLLFRQVKGNFEQTKTKWLKYKDTCLKKLNESTISMGIYCNGSFDQFVCWPHSPPGNVSVACPSYLPWLKSGSARKVYRVCLDQGIWQKIENTTEVWSHRAECFGEKHLKRKEEELTLFIALQKLSTVGYSFSLVFLVLALFILLLFRKLHCTRNYIHMNLFASFILRAAGVLIKDGITLNAYRFLSSESEKPDDESGWISSVSPEKLVLCRIAPLFMHYAVGANFYWVLVEGIYLYRLLVATVLFERHQLLRYIFIGWGFPVLFVASWGIIKYQFEYEGCWTTNESMTVWWIIRGPILFSIVGFFVALLCCFSNDEVKAELSKQWSRFLLAYPFVYMPCLLGKNIKYLRKCPNKQHLSNNSFSLEVTQPPKKQSAKLRTCCNVERSPTVKHNLRASVSDSSEEEIANGETIEEVLEENEI